MSVNVDAQVEAWKLYSQDIWTGTQTRAASAIGPEMRTTTSLQYMVPRDLNIFELHRPRS